MIKSTKHIQSSLSYFLIKKEKISLATFRHLYLDKVKILFKTQKMLIVESLGWKRALKWSSPSLNPTQPCSSLSIVLKCHKLVLLATPLQAQARCPWSTGTHTGLGHRAQPVLQCDHPVPADGRSDTNSGLPGRLSVPPSSPDRMGAEITLATATELWVARCPYQGGDRIRLFQEPASIQNKSQYPIGIILFSLKQQI